MHRYILLSSCVVLLLSVFLVSDTVGQSTTEASVLSTAGITTIAATTTTRRQRATRKRRPYYGGGYGGGDDEYGSGYGGRQDPGGNVDDDNDDDRPSMSEGMDIFITTMENQNSRGSSGSRNRGRGRGRGGSRNNDNDDDSNRNKRSYSRVRFPVRHYPDIRRFPLGLYPPFISVVPWLPIFYDKLTYQTFIFSPTGGMYILPPLINFYGQRFAVAQLIKWGYASLVSSGEPPPPNVNVAPLVQPGGAAPGVAGSKISGRAPAFNEAKGSFVGAVETDFTSFKPRYPTVFEMGDNDSRGQQQGMRQQQGMQQQQEMPQQRGPSRSGSYGSGGGY